VRNQVAFVVTALVVGLVLYFEARLMVWVMDSAFIDSLTLAGAVLVLDFTGIIMVCSLMALCYGVFRFASFLLSKVVLPKEILFLNRQMA